MPLPQQHRPKAAKPRRDWPRRPWYLSTLALGLAGAALLWAALPPLEWWPLAWIAPVPWLLLIRRKTLCGIQPDILPNKVHFVGHPNFLVFKSGLLFWLAALWWLTLPHWTGYFGWLGLSIYLAIYVSAFIGFSRVAVHRLRIPLIVAAPLVWTGLEFTRAHLFSGFLMAGLGHTQYRQTLLIQISDIAGAYGVSLLVMFVAACIAQMIPAKGQRVAWWPAPVAAVAVAAALGYGYWRTSDVTTTPGPKIALIQGDIDTVFGGDMFETKRRIYKEYMEISRQALAEADDIDLMIWPESMYRSPWIIVNEGADQPQPPATLEYSQAQLLEWERASNEAIAASARELGVPLLLGVDTTEFSAPEKIDRYSTSLQVSQRGEIVGHYHKVHPVIFGEYMPLGDWFPGLYELLPIEGGLTKGEGPQALDVAGARISPNICYETVLPHVIRHQVKDLSDRGLKPAVLSSQTNDGWFYGTSALDFHLICCVFRAVENRTPLVTAANTGISAWIDGDGRIVKEAGRKEKVHLIADVELDPRSSLYTQTGDLLAGAAAIFCGLLAVVGFVGGRRERRAAKSASET